MKKIINMLLSHPVEKIKPPTNLDREGELYQFLWGTDTGRDFVLETCDIAIEQLAQSAIKNKKCRDIAGGYIEIFKLVKERRREKLAGKTKQPKYDTISKEGLSHIKAVLENWLRENESHPAYARRLRKLERVIDRIRAAEEADRVFQK